MSQRINLPNFEGRAVEAVKFSATGAIDDENAQPLRALKIGETIVTVCVAQVVGVSHSEDKDGVVTRVQKAKFVEVREVAGQEGVDLLNSLREGATDDDNPTLRAV